MERNAQLTSFQVLDLNSGSGDGGGKGGVTFEVDGKKVRDGEVDVVICNVSVDYLVRPLEVFGEIWRFVHPIPSSQFYYLLRARKHNKQYTIR
jgi:hypothetical protein